MEKKLTGRLSEPLTTGEIKATMRRSEKRDSTNGMSGMEKLALLIACQWACEMHRHF